MLGAASSLVPASLAHLGLLLTTVAVYMAARWVYQRSGTHPFLIPVFTGVTVMVLVLSATDTAYADYAQATGILKFLIGPATVALAVPLYAQLPQLRRMWLPLSVALGVGCITAIVSALLIAWLLGGSLEVLLSLAPKSATMPVAIPASEAVGGIGSLAAVACAITGIAGVMMARPIFRLVGTQDPVVCGFTLGLTSHAIGTARSIQLDQQAGASAALAMGLNGLLTAALIPFVPWFV